jgi:cytochrome c
MKSYLVSGLLALFLGGTALAGEPPSPELGERLFQDASLGSAAKACATCHPQGKGLEEIGAYTDGQLKEMINFCIRDALKGEPLDPQSPELESIFLYLRSLGSGR